MPQVIPVIIGAGLLAAGKITLATFVLTAISTGLSIASGLLTPKNKGAGLSLADNGHLLNARSTEDPIRVVYGRTKVGGTQVFIEPSGGTNEYLHIVQTLAEGQCKGLVSLYLDDKEISTYGGDAYYEFFDGSPAQGVCATLQGYFPDWNDPMRNTCYVYVRLKYNREKYTGLPAVTAILDGRLVYDPRTGVTDWSDNAALCWYDFIRNRRFGAGIGPEWWDGVNVGAVADWCDEQGFRMNCQIFDQEGALDVSEKLLLSFRTRIIPSGDTFKLIALDYDAPVMELTEDDILPDTFRFTIPSVQQKKNVIKVRFVNKDNNYVTDTLPVPDPAAIADDGDENAQEVLLLGVDNREQAAKLGAYLLERSSFDRTYTFTAGLKAFPLEPGCIITVTHSRPGWIQKRVRVYDATVLPDNNSALTVVEEYPTMYDPVVNLTAAAVYECHLPDPLAVPPQVSNVAITEEMFAIKDNSYVRMKVSWEWPSYYPFGRRVEVWISRDDSDYSHYTDATGAFTIEPLKDGEQWFIKLVPVSIYEKARTLETTVTYSYTTLGKTDPPANVTRFMATVAGDTMHFRWEGIDEEDLLGYEVRYGGVWGSSIFYGLLKAETLSLVGVKPGLHSFGIKAKDTLGNYSANAAICTVTVFDPPGYSEKHSFGPNDFSTGTHDDTEQYDDPVHGYVLRVDHASGLAGVYTSPVYDMASVKKCRHWIDYDLILSATGATWEGGIGDVTWDTVLVPGETWQEQFANIQVGVIRMELLHSRDNALWETVDHMEIHSAEVEARYVQYRIYITDNDENSRVMVKPVTEKAWYWA